MNFASLDFLIFILLVFLLYWFLGRRNQNLLLLASSYLFYAFWDVRFLIPILFVTFTDFWCGARIHDAISVRQKKAWLLFSIAIDLGILGYFKYFSFFADSFINLAQFCGWHLSNFTVRILLPVGISFYIFRSLSYTIDIYRGRLKPTSSFVNYAVFISFFPHLAAGPITRAHEFIFQVEKPRQFNGLDLQEGLTRFLQGYFKKAFIADTTAFYIVDPVFTNPGGYSIGALWLGVLGYAVQIYADFSGYSSMAIGIARILGIKLPENFNFPYLSRNISEFWRHWHISMSLFFRDYVYISLGGNRFGRARTLRNLAATTLLSGLWHGAGLTYIIWGGLHGIYIICFHLWGEFRERIRGFKFIPGNLGILTGWVMTQGAVCFAWIVFRSRDFSSFLIYIKGLVYSNGRLTLETPVLVWVAFVFFLCDHLAGFILIRLPEVKKKVPVQVQGLAYALMIIFLYHTRLENANPFIYFKY